jgi:hypothetical protein
MQFSDPPPPKSEPIEQTITEPPTKMVTSVMATRLATSVV